MLARRFGVTTVVIGLVGLAMLVTPASEGALRGDPCVAPGEIKGMGAQPQTSLYIQHFIPKYEATCPEGIGKVSYDPLGDSVAIQAIVRHQSGKTSPDEAPYGIFSVDLPLTSAEKYSAEMDVYHPFNPRLSSFVNHFPIYVYGVAIGYNLGFCETGQQLRITAKTLSLIYSGAITAWNHPLLVVGDPTRPDDDNPFLGSCNMAINAARRDDEAAATIVLKDYLSQGNPLFSVYKTKELNTIWPQTLPMGCRAVFDSGMSTCLATPGTIGYVLYQEAFDESYNIAYLQNTSGTFLAPATTVWPPGSRLGWPDKCLAASQGAAVVSTQADWSRITLTTTGAGYPICGFGYMLAFQRPSWAMAGFTSQEIRTVVDFLTVAARDDVQDALSALHVSPITSNVRNVVRQGINNINDI